MTWLGGATNPHFPVLLAVIFLAELGVVTCGTLRIIFIARGRRYLAPALGFFEVSIWLFAVGQVMQNLSNIGCHLAFAGGFTAGNFLGILLEQKLALGTLVVRIITPRPARPLIEGLRAAGYGVTTMQAEGANGPVQVVFTIVPRRELDSVAAIILQFDIKAFYSVDDVQSANEGIFPPARPRITGVLPSVLRLRWAGR